LLCATLVGALGALAGGLALIGRNVPALEGATNWILRVLGNPLFWLALIVVSVLGRRFHVRRTHLRTIHPRRILTLGDQTDANDEGSPA
jgi:hypothetical protein